MENESKEGENINEIYKKLLSNEIIAYQLNTNNKIIKKITLNKKENEFFSIIINILKKNSLKTICRVAGGWVRDKLLGIESDDIDIVINDIKGREFAEILNRELYPGNTKYGIFNKNPQKEKNIEIVNIILFDTNIDVTNLRCEDLNKIGTPLSDAELRDFSINSLFYNVNEKKLEDFTQKGIKDLEEGLIATPVKPEITLRVQCFAILRMLRFAIKFKFRIVNDLNNFIENHTEEIIDKFYNKISKERIGKELVKILSIENSSFAIAYLYSYNILDIIYLIRNYDKKNKYEEIFLKNTNLYILGEYLLKKNKILGIEICSDNFNKIHYFLFLLLFYFKDKKISNAKINQQILKHTYKLGNDYYNANFYMSNNFDNLLLIINSQQYERLELGKILRKITHKYILSILYACIAYEYIENKKLNSLIETIDEDLLEKLIDKYKNFLSFIFKEDLFYIDKMKLLFNGKELIDILNMKNNKNIAVLMDYLLEEQIKNPKLNKALAIELIKKKNEEILLSKFDEIKKNSNKI